MPGHWRRAQPVYRLPAGLSLSHYCPGDQVATGYITRLHLAISVPVLGCTAVADGTGADRHTRLLAASYYNKIHVLNRGAIRDRRLPLNDLQESPGVFYGPMWRKRLPMIFDSDYGVKKRCMRHPGQGAAGAVFTSVVAGRAGSGYHVTRTLADHSGSSAGSPATVTPPWSAGQRFHRNV